MAHTGPSAHFNLPAKPEASLGHNETNLFWTVSCHGVAGSARRTGRERGTPFRASLLTGMPRFRAVVSGTTRAAHPSSTVQ